MSHPHLPKYASSYMDVQSQPRSSANELMDKLLGQLQSSSRLAATLAAPKAFKKVKPVWQQNAESFESDVGGAMIAETIRSLSHDLINCPQEIDFDKISRDAPNPQHLVAILRVSSVFRNKIKGWAHLREFAVNYLPRHDYDPEEVMQGLLTI